MKCLVKIICLLVICKFCDANAILNDKDVEDLRIETVVSVNEILIDIISRNWKTNGWTNILVVGNISNTFFKKIKLEAYSFTIIDFHKKHRAFKNVVPYHSNAVVVNCLDFDEFESAMTMAVKEPNWHPLSNIILYFKSNVKKDLIAKMFFIFWYHRAINAIIIQYDDSKRILLVSEYNPFTCEHIKFQDLYGCWTARKLGLPIESYEKSFICEEGCTNVPLQSKLRFNNLGTCLGFNTHLIPYNNKSALEHFQPFQDKGKNLHRCPLRAFAIDVLPFLVIREHENGSYTLHSRDGMLWNTMAELMNFTIDLSLGKGIMKKQFNFEINIQQVFAFIQRKADLLLYPLYQFDIVIAEVDNTIAYKESGVCFVSHRAGFETIIFDEKFLQKNFYVLVEFLICFLCTWFVFFIFNTDELGRFSLDQVGKDFINAFRIILSISLDRPPRRESFRIFFTVAIWSFFVINFSTQAAIVSIFSAHKRGKDVDTIEDVLERDYPIEGVASPDMILPEDEDRFRMLNSRRVPIQDMFSCVNTMSNDSRRFCVIDCAVGRYLERNRLNSKGQQYLHVATRDRIHSHYLNMILHRHSPLTATYNKIALSLVEAGIIRKWEQYRFNDIKEESPIKALNIEDVIGIFKCYCLLAVMSLIIFAVEVCTGLYMWIKNNLGGVNFNRWKYVVENRIRKLTKKKHHVNESGTQTSISCSSDLKEV